MNKFCDTCKHRHDVVRTEYEMGGCYQSVESTECRKKAPARGLFGRARFPVIRNPRSTWCGDYEKEEAKK